MGLTVSLAEFVVKTGYEDLPERAIALAKSSFLDTMGIAVGGSVERGAQLLVEYVRRCGGAPVASAIGRGFKTSARNAALVNGMAGDALALSATSEVVNHPTVTALPAIWAVAETTGAPGKEVLLAEVLGVEVACKIARPLHPALTMKGWEPITLFGAFGATAAAGKLLGLDAHQMANALGLAGVEASGVKAAQGSLAKSYNRGRAAENGVAAAELAAMGFTGPTAVLEGLDGFFQTFGDGASCQGVVPSLGNPYEIASPGLTLKAYPCCTHAHTSIDGALKLRGEHRLTPDQIESVECLVGPGTANVLKFSHPGVPAEAKYSGQFCCAVALVDGEVTTNSFTPEKLADPRILDLVGRTRMTISPELAELHDSPEAEFGSTVVIRLKNGERYSHRQDRPAWGPATPPSWEALLSKYRACAGRVLSPARVEETAEIIEHLEEAQSLRRLMDIVRA